MTKLSNEQTEFAVATLQKWMDSREVTQTDLEQMTGVYQSTISKILNRSQAPSVEVRGRGRISVKFRAAD